VNIEQITQKDRLRQELIQACVEQTRVAVGAAAKTYQEQQYLQYKIGAALLAGVLEHLDQEVLKQDIFQE
jgi:hypothetical protein